MRSLNPFRAKAKKKGARRRRGNKWLRRAAPIAAVVVPVLALIGGATWLWRAGYVAEASAAVRDGVAEAAGSFGLSVGNVYLEGRENAGKDEVMTALPWIADVNSGYLMRGMAKFPLHGDREPWTNPQVHEATKRLLAEGPEDGVLTYAR